MAGGGGTRFWPRSRKARPKQFLALTGERTLIQQTADRVEALVAPERTWIITSAEHQAEVGRQLHDVPSGQIVGEPIGRDTAACIGLGAALIAARDPSAAMVVLPADHVIEPAQEFRRALHAATQLVEEFPNALITFGISPTFPATGYGYIHRGQDIGTRQGLLVNRVAQFREKPSVDLAEQFVATGNYSWNSGIFCWKASTVLAALRSQQPRIHDAVSRIAAAWETPRGPDVLAGEYEALPRISIDYAVLEKYPERLVLQAPFHWDDVGSWLAMERLHPQDVHGNTILAKHLGVNTARCVVVGDAERLIATTGVCDLLIIQDADATLIAHRSDEAGIKLLVEELGKQGLERFQ
jgi:mannose-1-phosphate guanylyltransferase